MTTCLKLRVLPFREEETRTVVQCEVASCLSTICSVPLVSGPYSLPPQAKISSACEILCHMNGESERMNVSEKKVKKSIKSEKKENYQN